MSQMRIEELLQDCLDGYEAGLTPEECLSAYPRHRSLLEPMLRQALSLRVAYAISPSEEFRHQAREHLMFAAGRDVQLALVSEPDPNFILQARTRFLNVAGATATEALRDVPPPRLAFWVNARRRLLEAAANTSPAPARRFGTAMRYSLSAAVVAIAITVAALAPFGGGNSPDTADAQLAALEEQIIRVERLTQEGQPVSAEALDDLADRTSQITSTLNDQDLERAEKIGGLILRQQEVAKQISPDEPALVEAQQKLAEAQQKLGDAKGLTPTIAAAIIDSTVESAAIATETEEPVPTPTPVPIADGGYQRTLIEDEATAGLAWEQISTSTMSFLVPTNWQTIGLAEEEDGSGVLTGEYIRIDTDGEEPVIILISTNGETVALISGVSLLLRGPGPDGATIAPETLVNQLGDLGIPLHRFVLSISVTPTP